MRTLAALFLFLVILAPAHAANKNKRKTSSVPEHRAGRFTDKLHGFSIALPADWQQEKDMQGTAVIALSKYTGSNDPFRENINVVVEALTAKMSTADYFASSQNAIQKIFQEFKLEKTGKEKIGNHDSLWSIYSYKTPTARARVLQYVIVSGAKAYVITCSATPDQFNRFQPIFTASAKSFRTE